MPTPPLKHSSWKAKAIRNAINRTQGTSSHISRVARPLRPSQASSKTRRNNQTPFYKSKRLWLGASAFAGISLVALVIFTAVISRDLPEPGQLLNRDVAESTKIYDRNGNNVLYEIHGEQKRTLIPLSQIPVFAQKATIAIEDKSFYEHGAISPFGIFRALVKRVLFGKSEGGSTLTQQFIKKAVLTDEQTITRKLKEAVLAYKLENKFSKDEVLQMYLNEIPYGSNAYGIQAASQKYFGHDAKDLSLQESAVLAAMIQAPSRYSPYGPNKDFLLERGKYILGLMAEQGYISEQERDMARASEIKFKGPETNITAPHFVMYVKEMLSEKYGEKTVEQGGLKIYTTLDTDKQKAAEEAIVNRTKDYAKKYNANNAAMAAIDPKTGQILAMVGSRDYFDDSIDGQVNITTSLRQPGSSIKPIVYASLFMKGYTPNSILYDVVTNFAASGKAYEPKNYDLKEYGPVSIRQALAGSLNVPAVKAIYLAGVKAVIELAKDMGYSSLNDPDRFGLSLVLGGAEVKLIEHVNAYSAFAREGEVHPLSAILKVEDRSGKILEEFKDKKKTVFEPKIARMINNIMSDNNARSFIFGEKNYLVLSGRPVAAKTGTTNDYKDAWTIGYTPSLVTGVWVGNNDSQKMKKGSDGSVLAAPIWNDFMKKALEGTPVEQFGDPGDMKTGKPVIDGEVKKIVKINKQSGELATESTPTELIEEKTIYEPHSILYYVDKEDPLGPNPSDPSKDSQFSLWESRVVEWAKKNNLYSSSTPMLGEDSLYNPKNNPEFTITSPDAGQIVNSSVLDASIEITKIMDMANVEYYINGNLLYKTNNAPFTLHKDISFLNNGYHNLKVRVCDNFYNCSSKESEFNLLVNSASQSSPSLNLVYPGSGLAVTDNDFPLGIQFSYSHPEKIATLKLHLIDSSNVDKEINSLNMTSDKSSEISWDEKPPAGSFKIYGEAIDWSGNSHKSNKVSISVN